MSKHKHVEENDLERGKRFLEIRKKIFENKSRREVGEILGGYEQSRIRTWENGYPIPNTALIKLYELGVDIVYLLSGEKSDVQKDAGLTEAQKAILDLSKKMMSEGLDLFKEGEKIARSALTNPNFAKQIIDKGIENAIEKQSSIKKHTTG